MGIFNKVSSFFGKKSTVRNEVDIAELLGMSASGASVNTWTALGQSTVLQCLTILSNGVSQVPFRLMKEQGRKKTPATGHPLYYLFKEKPNKWQSSFEFRQMLMLQLALNGECIVWKVKVRGVIQQLIPFGVGRYHVTQDSVGGWYSYTYHLIKDDGSMVSVPESDIWHLRWRGYELRQGLPQMELARNTVGVALAGDSYAGSTLKNSARPSGILTAATTLQPAQKEEIQRMWDTHYSGAQNANKTAVLSADLKYQPLGMTNTDAQFIENRKFQIEEICRLWNVNPFLVFYQENTASYGNSEQMMIQHLVHTLAPWYTLFEESAYVNLLTEDERREQGLYFAFNENALMRSDAKSRGEFYAKLFMNAGITPNEIREKEEMEPMEGGDKLYVQGAMVPLEDAGKNINNAPQTLAKVTTEPPNPDEEDPV